MALTKTFTAMTWASGSATASGTTNAVDVSGSYGSEIYVRVVQVGTASTAASFDVSVSGDGTNYRGSLGTMTAGTADATYKWVVPLPLGCSSIEIVYVAQSGGTSSTLTADVSRTTAL